MCEGGLKQNMESATADKAVASVGSLFNDSANAYLYQNLNKYANAIAGSYAPYAQRDATQTPDTHKTYQGS